MTILSHLVHVTKLVYVIPLFLELNSKKLENLLPYSGKVILTDIQNSCKISIGWVWGNTTISFMNSVRDASV